MAPDSSRTPASCENRVVPREMTDLERTRQLADSTEGWLYPREGPALYELARSCRTGVVVEIGSWKGKSTVWLARGAAAGSGPRVYAIDPHQGGSGESATLEAFTETLERAGITEIVRPIVGTSAGAADGFDEAVGLLFIDGDHSVEGVEDDLTHWLPKLVEGGVVALHDASLSELAIHGPRRVTRRLLAGSTSLGDLRVAGTVVYATKGARRGNSLLRLALLSLVEGFRVRWTQPARDLALVARQAKPRPSRRRASRRRRFRRSRSRAARVRPFPPRSRAPREPEHAAHPTAAARAPRRRA